MKNGKILVQKVNMEEVDLQTVSTFQEKIKETLPANIKSIIVPHTWDFKQIEDGVIYIGMDYSLDIDLSATIVSKVSEALGDGYTVVTNLGKAEIISEKN